MSEELEVNNKSYENFRKEQSIIMSQAKEPVKPPLPEKKIICCNKTYEELRDIVGSSLCFLTCPISCPIICIYIYIEAYRGTLDI